MRVRLTAGVDRRTKGGRQGRPTVNSQLSAVTRCARPAHCHHQATGGLTGPVVMVPPDPPGSRLMPALSAPLLHITVPFHDALKLQTPSMFLFQSAKYCFPGGMGLADFSKCYFDVLM